MSVQIPSKPGVTTTAPVGSSPNSAGALISGQVIALEPADGTHPGVVTTGAQTFAGVKTFTNGIVADVSSSTATATGATTSRTLSSYFSDYLNVKDYGAKGDGVTDDTIAIQSALNAKNSIYFPPGAYLITNSLTLSDRVGVNITGSFQESYIINNAPANKSTLVLNSVRNFVIEKLSIIGQTGFPNHGIEINKTTSIETSNGIIRDILLQPNGYGFLVNQSVLVQIENVNYWSGNTGFPSSADANQCKYAFFVDIALSGQFCNGYYIKKCNFTGIDTSISGAACIKMGATLGLLDNNTVENCELELASGTALDITGAYNFHAFDNYTEHSAILIANSRECIIATSFNTGIVALSNNCIAVVLKSMVMADPTSSFTIDNTCVECGAYDSSFYNITNNGIKSRLVNWSTATGGPQNDLISGVQATGQVGIINAPTANNQLSIAGTSTLGQTVERAMNIGMTFSSSATTSVTGVNIGLTTGSGITTTNSTNFSSTASAPGAGSTITRYTGFRDTGASTHPATNNASLSDNASFTSNWFINQSGTDPSTFAGQLQSTVTTGTAPLAVASTTKVANLYVDRAALADTTTTNANLTGVITSVGNATSIASQTGTGTKFVVDTSPTLVTPNLGTPTVLVGTNITGTAAGLTSGNVTTNANLTGVITSVGNATSIASQTGTGTKFVVDTNPTLVTPNIGAATGTSLQLSGLTATQLVATDASKNLVSQATGNLTDAGTDGITITNGTGSVIGTGTSISQHVADTTHNGYLSSTDWNTFNNKQPAGSYVAGASNLTTVGSVPYVSASGTVSQDPSDLFLDTTNHRLGVKMQTPVFTLDVGGDINLPDNSVLRSSGNALINRNSSTSVIGIGSGNVGDTLSFFAGGAAKVTVGTSGVVNVSNLTASLPVQTDASKNLVSSAIDLSGSQATGTLAAGRFPALTGDITTSAGSLATSLSSTLAGNKQFTGQVGIINAPTTNNQFSIVGTSTLGQTVERAVNIGLTSSASATSSLTGVNIGLNTAAGITTTSVINYASTQVGAGIGSTVTRYVGFRETGSATHPATNNASLSDNSSFTGNYFINQSGTDPSTFAGNILAVGTFANTTASAANVFIDTDGTLRRSTSSIKYKQDIREDVNAALVDQLKPITYEPKNAVGNRYYGFIAEEIEKIDPRLVTHGQDGNPEGVEYERIIVLLVKAFQELKNEFEEFKKSKE